MHTTATTFRSLIFYTILSTLFITMETGCNKMSSNNHLEPAAGTPHEQPLVIVLHGLARSADSMNKMAETIAAAGFSTINLSYPSTEMTIEELVDLYLTPAIDQQVHHGVPIHFVTHSMGGILVRSYLEKHQETQVANIVMLSPPNQGSELIDSLGDNALFRSLYGPAALQLSTSPSSLVNRLSSPDMPTGIIAGTRSYNPISSLIIPGQDDGKVSIERMYFGDKAHKDQNLIQVPCSHTFIMNDQNVIRETIYFLRHSSFQ